MFDSSWLPAIFLFVVFQWKHFVADYIWQTPYMFGKFKDKDWIKPLAAHCGVHAGLTFVYSASFLGFGNILEFAWLCLCLSLFDFATHFVMDRIKASPRLLGRYKALSSNEFSILMKNREWALTVQHEDMAQSIDERFRRNKYFWWSLGFDQMVHHLTHYAIIFVLLSSSDWTIVPNQFVDACYSLFQYVLNL